MTENIKLALWCTWLSLFALPAWAAPQFTVPTVTKRVPANVDGTLNFASMQFWIETSKGERIMLMPWMKMSQGSYPGSASRFH